jgi:hypothetical protein
MRVHVLAALLLLSAVGCASAARPGSKHPTPAYLSAMYDVQREGASLAIVELSADDPVKGELNGAPAILVHLVARVANHSETPISLSHLALSARVNGKRITRDAPAEIEGDPLVGPWLTATVGLTFTLPAELVPEMVDALLVSWHLDRLKVEVFSQTTAFRRARDTYDDDLRDRFYFTPLTDAIGAALQVHDYALYVGDSASK